MNETSSALSSSAAAAYNIVDTYSGRAAIAFCVIYEVCALAGLAYAEFFRRTRRLEFRKYRFFNLEFRFNFLHGTIIWACAILLLRGIAFLQNVSINNYAWILHIFQHLTHPGMVTMLSFLFCVWLHHYRGIDVCEKFLHRFHFGLWIANSFMYVAAIILFVIDGVLGNSIYFVKYKFVYILFTLTAFLSGVWGLHHFVKNVLPKRFSEADQVQKWDVDQNMLIVRTMDKTTLAIGAILGINLVIMFFLAFIHMNQMLSLGIATFERFLELVKLLVVILSVRYSSRADNITEKNHPLLEDEGTFDV